MGKYASVHPQLRMRGRLTRMILGDYSVGALRVISRLSGIMGRKRAKKLKGMRVEPITIQACGHPMRMCVYRPIEDVANTPGLLWIHGGGYAMGFPEQDERFIRRFIETVPCTVVAPDYRLSGKAPYPAAIDDCCEALVWLDEHAAELGVRRDQLMVGGDSAGGGLAAAVTIRARDERLAAIAFQMPLYPMLDDRMITASSRNNSMPVWSSKSNESAWRLYLGERYGSDDVPPDAAPSRLTDLAGLPPAFTFVGSLEPFLDETVEYMERLKQAGVPAEYKVFEGCYHAFDMMCSGSEPAKEANALLLESFRRASEQYFAAPYERK